MVEEKKKLVIAEVDTSDDDDEVLDQVHSTPLSSEPFPEEAKDAIIEFLHPPIDHSTSSSGEDDDDPPVDHSTLSSGEGDYNDDNESDDSFWASETKYEISTDQNISQWHAQHQNQFGGILTFHSVQVRGRTPDRVPVFLNQQSHKLYYFTHTRNKTYISLKQKQTFQVVGASQLDLQGVNPTLLLPMVSRGGVHKLHDCWCDDMDSIHT